MIHLLLKPVVSLSGRHQGTYLVFEGHAFRVVLVKPSLRGFLAVEDLEMVMVSDLLAGVDVDPDCHLTLAALASALAFSFAVSRSSVSGRIRRAGMSSQ